MEKIIYAIVILGVMGAAFGAVLAVASKVFAVKVDERLPKLVEALPGANCGGCGFAGCQAYAQAVLEGRAPIGLCAAGGSEAAEKMSAVMGVEAQAVERKVAMVKCRGQNHLQKASYAGIPDCRSAMFVTGNGPSACPSGCLGFGTCAKVCPFDAIHVVNGVAVVDKEACKACKKCIAVCPKHLISLVPYDAKFAVACSSRDKGPVTMKACQVGCIGCGICVKNCPNQAVTVTEFHAVIDQEKCTGCGTCAEKCPKKAIVKH